MICFELGPIYCILYIYICVFAPTEIHNFKKKNGLIVTKKLNLCPSGWIQFHRGELFSTRNVCHVYVHMRIEVMHFLPAVVHVHSEEG